MRGLSRELQQNIFRLVIPITFVVFFSPTTIPNAPKVRDFGWLQYSGSCSMPMGTIMVLLLGL